MKIAERLPSGEAERTIVDYLKSHKSATAMELGAVAKNPSSTLTRLKRHGKVKNYQGKWMLEDAKVPIIKRNKKSKVGKTEVTWSAQIPLGEASNDKLDISTVMRVARAIDHVRKAAELLDGKYDMIVNIAGHYARGEGGRL